MSPAIYFSVYISCLLLFFHFFCGDCEFSQWVWKQIFMYFGIFARKFIIFVLIIFAVASSSLSFCASHIDSRKIILILLILHNWHSCDFTVGKLSSLPLFLVTVARYLYQLHSYYLHKWKQSSIIFILISLTIVKQPSSSLFLSLSKLKSKTASPVLLPSFLSLLVSWRCCHFNVTF